MIYGKRDNPSEARSVEGGEDGPLPLAAFLSDGGQGGYTREVYEHEEHITDGGQWGDAFGYTG